eukprot:356232-Chlamydomonas_euryale.AAC.23
MTVEHREEGGGFDDVSGVGCLAAVRSNHSELGTRGRPLAAAIAVHVRARAPRPRAVSAAARLPRTTQRGTRKVRVLHVRPAADRAVDAPGRPALLGPDAGAASRMTALAE